MDRRETSPSSGKLVDCSFLQEHRMGTADSPTDHDNERTLLLDKVNELYGKLEDSLNECIQLKKENHVLKMQLETQSRDQYNVNESRLSESKRQALFDMFLQKISKLDEENRWLKGNQENVERVRTVGYGSPLHSPLSSLPSQIMKSPTAKSSLMSSPRDVFPADLLPTTRPKPQLQSKLRNSIDMLWGKTAASQPSGFMKRS